MKKKKNDGYERFRKLFNDACMDESMGGNAGPNCVGVNTIVDEKGAIYGFSNSPEDYIGRYWATIRVNYSDVESTFNRQLGREGLLKKIASHFEKPKKYIDLIFIREEERAKLAEVGEDINEIKDAIRRQFAEAGYIIKERK